MGTWVLRRRLGCGVLTLVALTACSAPAPPDAGSYVEAVKAARAAKDEAFREASDSPIPPNRRDDMLPLSYFPIDPAYNVPAVLQRPTRPEPTVEMPTSTGLQREMMRVGRLEFNLKGKALALSAFVETSGAGADRLFVPFTDLTTGTETYPGGRYLDLDRTATGIYELDFNLAYHPYCYFSAEYDCPYPPPENRLDVPVRAGERLPE